MYLFGRTGDAWSQQAYVKASNAETADLFGDALALSADGSTLAIGAPSEGSSATGIDGDQNNNLADGAGAVYVFSRTGDVWSQPGFRQGQQY